MEYGPFWDDACLGGEIGTARAPAASSLFDSDLFCDEETLDAVVPEPSQPPAPPQPALMPLPLPPPPSSGADAWRTFMDDNCPFRRRVKVTIAPTRKRTARVALATCTATVAPPARAPARKRARCDSPSSQAVLHFPPQFAAPVVPRRVRVVAPRAAAVLADSLLLDGLACLEDDDDDLPFSGGTPCSPRSPALDVILASSTSESPRSARKEERGPLQVNLTGVSQLATSDSHATPPDSPCSDADGYMTSKLQSRLRDVLAPPPRSLDCIAPASRTASSTASAARARACALPRVDAALLAVTRAAAAYSAQLSLSRA